MTGKEKDIEFKESGAEQDDIVISAIRDFITGRVLTRKTVSKQLPFIIFLVVVALMYIGNRYRSESIVRDTYRIQNELKDLRAESISKATELMYSSRQSQVLKLLREKNIKLGESVVPPKKIVKE